MTCRAIGFVSRLSPESNAGWPQHACPAGTTTSQPARSRSLTAAKPTEGRIVSTRHVTKRPTVGRSARMLKRMRLDIGIGKRPVRLRGHLGAGLLAHAEGSLRQQEEPAALLLH